MPVQRLAIPLNTNPARQKLWRAVGSASLLVLAVTLGYFINRYAEYRSSPQRWPAEAVMQVKIIKTPQSLDYVRTNFSGVQALPGAPWSLYQTLGWTKREFLLYTDNHDIVGIMVDGKISTETQDALEKWGWKSFSQGKKNLIVRTTSKEPLEAKYHPNFWLTLPIYDGLVTLKQPSGEMVAVPFRYSSETSLDFPVNMESFMPATQLALSANTILSASAAAPASLTSNLTPKAIPGAFPGLKQLGTVIGNAGFNFVMGEDQLGPAFSISTTSTAFSLEELGAIAQEGVSLQTLSTTALTIDDLSTSQEIRSQSDISVEVQASEGINTAIARDQDGHIFRLTQSANQLIVSNRLPLIGLDSANNPSFCLRRSAGFIKPAQISAYLPLTLSAEHKSLTGRLAVADEIAFRKNLLRICW